MAGMMLRQLPSMLLDGESKQQQGWVTAQVAPRSCHLQSLSVELTHALAKSLHPA